ncbi:MAG: tetratricopeptide repeat protein [Polyangia bacterium]
MRRVVGILGFGICLTCGLSPRLSIPSACADSPADVDALAALGRAIDASPSPVTYDAYAQAAFRAHRWGDAVARLKVGTAELPAYHQGWYKLAYAYRQQHAFGEAAAAYRKFAELEPAQADPYFGLGAALEGIGDRAGAIEAYRRYIELEKAPGKQRFVDQARAQIDKLGPSPGAPTLTVASSVPPPMTPPPVLRDPTPPPVTPPPLLPALQSPVAAVPAASSIQLRAEADRLRRAGKLPEAAKAFERALAADPGNLDLHVELGDIYFAQKRYPEAARVFRASVDRDAGYALGWYNLAHAEAQAGDQKGAIQSYRAYIRLRPSDPDPYYGLGHACKAAGDRDGAIEAFRSYLQMERRPELQRWIDRARKELRDLGGTEARNELRDLMDPFDRARGHDLKNPFADRPAYASNDDLLPAYEGVLESAHLRLARELAADDILPVHLGDGLDDDDLAPVDAHVPKDQRARLARYATALAAYRGALEHEANEAALLYQRGADRLMVADLRGAQRVWTQSPTDRAIVEARQRLDKAREAIATPQ